MVGFTVPLAMLGTAAAKTFMAMEEQAIRFKRVYGDMFTTKEQTDEMIDQIQTLAREYTKYGVAVEETMKMAADAAAMGKVGSELTAQVAEATRLAVLGGVEQEQALETTISVTNAFGVAAEDLAKKIDFLNAVENQTVVSIEDLTIAIPKAGPVVQQLGGDVEDLAFFLTAMKEGGINASEGANALKSGLASLINPSEKASKFLAGLGINIKGIVEANKGDVKSTVIDFSKALDTLDPLNRARAIEQLFGKFQFSRLSTLFQNVTAEGTQASRVLELTKNTTEELAILSERELGKIEETTTYKFKKALEDLKVTLIPVGEQFLKALTPIVEFAAKILDKFNDLGDGSKRFITIMTVALGAIGPIALMSFGLLANGIANIIKLFATLRGGFQQAGSSTQILGEQTNYLTKEQLEASAVAASLDQVHQRLKQTFTSEASAVNALTAAYQRAMAAQRSFGMPGAPRPGVAPKKFAEGGIISGPGGPKSDSVPIMASNGEAIISAEVVDKYPGLVQGLISGKIPGFKKAGIVGQSQETMAKGFGNATIFLPESINTAMGGSGAGAASGDVTGYLKGAGRAAMAPLMAALAREMGIGLNNPKYIEDFRRLGDQLVVNATNALEQSGRKFVTDSDFEEIVVPAMRRAASEVTVAGKQVGTAFDNAVTQIRTVGPVGVGSGSSGGQGRTGLAGSYRNMRKSAQTFASNENPGYFQKKMRFSKSRNKEVPSFQTLNPALQKFEVATMSHITRSVTMSVSNLIEKVKPYLGDQSARIVKAVTKSTVDGMKVATKVASPSKVTQKVGADIGRGAVIGIQSYVDDASAAGKQLGAATVRGSQSMAAASRTALYGTGPIDANQKSLRRYLEKQQKRSDLGKNVGQPASVITSGTAASANKQTLSSKMSAYSQKLKDRRAERKDSGKGMGAGGKMMAASGVMMAASMMPGQVGDAAQKLMMPMMALSMVMPLLESKMGIAAVAIGAIVGTIYMFNESIKKARTEGIELAKSMSMGAEKIKALSMVTGKVSATEAARRRRENIVSGSSEGQRRSGQTILDSDFGKTLMSDIDKQAKAGIDPQAIGKNISTNLAQAVMQGVISTDQAKSIASALGEQLGDYTIPAEITGNLVQLLGPNGENVLADPLSVALKVKADSMNNVTEAFNQALTGANISAVKESMPWWKKVLDAPVIIGRGGFEDAELQKRNTKLDAAAVQIGVEAVQANQASVDSLNKQYAIKIQNAKTDKEALALEDERKKKVDALNQANKTTLTEVRRLSQGLSGDQFTKSINASVDLAYKDSSDAVKTFVGQAKDQLGQLADSPFKTNLQLGFASKDLSASTIIRLLQAGTEDKYLEGRFNLLIEEQGFANADTIFQLLSKTGAKAPEISVLLNYVNQNKESFDTDLAAIQALSGFKDQYGITLNLKTNGVKQMQVATAALAAIAPLPEKLDFALITRLAGENPAVFAGVKQDWAALSEGKDTINKNLVVNYLVGKGDPNVIAAANNEFAGKGLTPSGATAAYIAKGYVNPVPTKIPKPVDTGSKTGPDASALDDLVKRLRDVRNNTIKVTQGFNASSKALNKLFGGNKTIKIFSGIENDMRRLGAGEDLIELVVGMDPKEYEKQKNKLFKFDKGEIVGIKDTARSIGDALQSVKLGEFVSEQEKMVKQIGSQTTALNRLKAAGVEGSVALEAVADATFAAAIANKKLTDKDVRKIVNSWKEATKAKKDYMALEALQEEETELDANVTLLQRMTSVMGEFSQEQVNAIMQSERLKTALVNLASVKPGSEGYKRFLDVLKKALNKEKVQLEIDLVSIEGMQKVFDRGFSNAIEQADVAEKKLQLTFDADTAGLQKTIDLAQDKIDAAQEDIDDREAALRAIEKQEEKINEKYDERIKALDEVEKANAAISQQQKGQLTLAEALTSGDIAAAAKAAQEMRAQQAADAVTKEKEALEKSKQKELDRVTQDGKTRKQLEKEIKDLEDKIFNWEEKDIEPAQKAIRELSIPLREAVRELDKFRRYWEGLQNTIDVARTNSKKFLDEMKLAESVVDTLASRYRNETSNIITSAGTLIPGGTGTGATDTGSGASGVGLGNNGTGTQVPGGSTGSGDTGSGNTGGSTGGTTGGSTGKSSPSGFKETSPDPYKNTWMTINDPTARAHVKDMETNIAANIVRNSELFNREVNALKIKENAGDGAAMHYKSLNQLTDQMNLAKKYNTGPDYAKQQAENLAANKASAAKKAADEATLKKFGGNQIAASQFGNWPVKRAMGGIIPKRFALGGFAKGTDTVPAMLTPGEFIMSKYAVDSYGVDNMRKINNGDSIGGTVYNNTYTLTVNAKTDANPNDIAQAVMSTIKRVDDRRIRGVSLNGR
jgi:TP901 family phage tail tape measure protein